MRKPRDRDFLETEEGMFFCVAGYLHPPDKITAYLKYSPAAKGKWKRGDISYRRELPFYHVFSVSHTIDYLKKNYPHYVYFCPVRHIEMSMIPRSYIKRYYRPEERMSQLCATPQDKLEIKVARFAKDIMDHINISLDSLGITGSILIGLHNPLFSDIDLIVYGLNNSLKLKEELSSAEYVEILSGKKKEEWIQHKMEIFHIDRDQAQRFASRKWNYGYYKGTYFSVHPTRTDAEIDEEYGDVEYRGLGAVVIQAEIINSQESMFLPAKYKIKLLKVCEGLKVPIEEIISYEGIYCDVFCKGERIEARGRLEKYNGNYRLVLGTLEVENQYIRFM